MKIAEYNNRPVGWPKFGRKRRGAVAVLVAVCSIVIMAFAALTVDVGVMYNAKTDLQRLADAAALAAASRLGEVDDGDPIPVARSAAHDIAALNPVLGKKVLLEDADIVFGHAKFDPNSRQFTFVPSTHLPDAVQVIARKTEGSANGPLNLFFGRVLGVTRTDVAAEAIALLLPRDIAVVADLSRSHNYDSTFRQYKRTRINLYEVWDSFRGGIDDDESTWTETSEVPTDPALAAQMGGPAWGFFKQLGFGTIEIEPDYDPNADPGLIRLAYNQNWSDTSVPEFAALSSYLAVQKYSANEISAILSRQYDGNGSYAQRVAVALGLAVWNSGMPGGRWQQVGNASSGNNDARIHSGEIEFVETFGDRSAAESGQLWLDYIDNYVRSSRSEMASANSALQYQYGIKTFMDYLMVRRTTAAQTPELAGVPHQPMQAVKDAVSHLAVVVESLKSNDRLSLEVYGTTGRHEVNLTTDYFKVVDRLNQMQAGHYESYTNMGAGILRGIEELTSHRASPVARKIIILLTDGNANVGCDGCTDYNESAGRTFALDMARKAAESGIQLFTVSVGAESDAGVMQEIAGIGGGSHFHAEGSIDEYSDQLDAIFQALGGKRPVELIR